TRRCGASSSSRGHCGASPPSPPAPTSPPDPTGLDGCVGWGRVGEARRRRKRQRRRRRVGYTSGMCGRFLLFSDGPTLAVRFDLTSFPELAPRYNIAPTQPVAAVRAGGGGRECVALRWGLVPSWARDARQAPIIARAETAAEKPTFRAAFRKRRCL